MTCPDCEGLAKALERMTPDYPWERQLPGEGLVTTDEPWECEWCFASVPYNRERYEQPPATEGHNVGCDWLRARAALAPIAPQEPSLHVRLRRALHRYDGLVKHHEPGWIDADLCYQCDTIAATLLGSAEKMDAPRWPEATPEHVEALAAAIHGDDCTCPFTPIEPDYFMARAILTALAAREGDAG